MSSAIVFKYFPELTERQKEQIDQLGLLYRDWNQKINVVSRKDIDELYLRHVLHSLALARMISFQPGTEVLDVGTGGGFPGIPLAILFPEVRFTLIDSVGKKIKVVEEVVAGLGLKNVVTVRGRVEDLDRKFDFMVSRAVAAMPTFVRWVRGKFKSHSRHELTNGLLYLKGGDLADELKGFKKSRIVSLRDFFEEEHFATKYIVYIPAEEIEMFK